MFYMLKMHVIECYIMSIFGKKIAPAAGHKGALRAQGQLDYPGRHHSIVTIIPVHCPHHSQ